MKDNISPEEKLLKLIRDKKKEPQQERKTPEGQPEVKPVSPSAIMSMATASRIGKPKLNLGVLFKNYLPFVKPRWILGFIFTISCLYLLFSFIYPFVFLKKISLPQVAAQKESGAPESIKSEQKPYEFYLEGIKDKQIFATPAALQAANRPQSGVNVDLGKDISLVGIIAGDNPQAVVEDKKTQKSYYLGIGQFIGEYQVVDIQEGKVIVNYRGQNFELYL